MMNVSPTCTSVTVYKGTTLTEFVPHRNIALVNDSVSLSVNLYSVSEDGSLGRTSVMKYGIDTTIWQPMQCQAEV